MPTSAAISADAARTALHQAVNVTARASLTIDRSGVPLPAAAGVAVSHDAARMAAVTGRNFTIVGPRPCARGCWP